jgi:triosephosphate isomerase
LRTLLVNYKNYPEVLGEGSVRLALAVMKGAEAAGVEGIVAPPIPMLGLVASQVRVQVYSQTMEMDLGGKTTGSLVPEAVKAAGGRGTILNHSESRKTNAELRKLVPLVKGFGLGSCVCAQTAAEAARLSFLGPKYLAVEPPELIGSGIAVSRAKPQLIQRTVAAARRAGYEGPILCGAGIVEADDVKKAVELGADGILVASSIVKAKDWCAKVAELAGALA